MPVLSKLFFIVLSMAAVTSPVRASEPRLNLGALRLPAFPSALASSGLAPSLLLAEDGAVQPVSSAASTSSTPREADGSSAAADRHVQRKIVGAGYGLAAGIGMVVPGVVLAAQTRPNNWESPSALCTESRPEELKILSLATGAIGAGLALSSGMLAWLIGMRRAHPEVRASRRTRGLQALVGVGAASMTAAILTVSMFGCFAS